jgi:hypothetical protein
METAWCSVPGLLYALFLLLCTFFSLLTRIAVCCKYVLRTADLCKLCVITSLDSLRGHQGSSLCRLKCPNRRAETVLLICYYFALYHYYCNFFQLFALFQNKQSRRRYAGLRYGNHQMDHVMIRPPGIDNGAFIVSSESVRVCYARVLLLFSAPAMTDTESKSFNCALVSILETYDDPESGKYAYYTHYMYYL